MYHNRRSRHRLWTRLLFIILCYAAFSTLDINNILFPYEVEEHAINKTTQSPLLNQTKQIDTKLDNHPLSSDIYIFSSFVDLRNGNMNYPCVRLLTILEISDSSNKYPTIRCIFNNNNYSIVNGTFYRMSENHAKAYGTYVISCCDDQSKFIDQVTVEYNNNQIRIPISYKIYDDQSLNITYQFDYTICVPMLFGTHYRRENLIEFMEFNKIFGVNHVFIYVDWSNIIDEMRETIEYYSMKNELTAITFSLPIADDLIWYHGQLVTINDCLYRNSGLAKWTAFIDIDELIVPQSINKSIVDLIESSDNTIGSYRLPTRYFYNYPVNAIPIGVSRLSSSIAPLDIRFTKCIVRPQMVFEQGIHHTSRVIQDHYQAVPIDQHSIQLYHYKLESARGNGFKVMERTHMMGPYSIVDYLPKNYGHVFFQRYHRVLRELLQLSLAK